MQQTQIKEARERKVTELVPQSDPRSSVVSIDPERHGGTPCFAGTRAPLQDLWDYLAEGESIDSFLDSFPTVTQEQVTLAIRLAGEKFLEGLPVR